MLYDKCKANAFSIPQSIVDQFKSAPPKPKTVSKQKTRQAINRDDLDKNIAEVKASLAEVRKRLKSQRKSLSKRPGPKR